jgi:hypothetical protein
VDLGELVGFEPKVAPAVPEFGVFFAGGVFFAAEGLGVFAGPGEPLAPLGLGGSDALVAVLVASGLRGFSALGASSPFYGSFVEESGSMSCGSLHKLRNYYQS